MSTRQGRNFTILVLFIAALLISSNPVVAQSGPSEPMPVIGMDAEKAIVVRVEVAGNVWTPSSVEVVTVPPPALIGAPPMMHLTLIDDNGQIAQEFNYWDPRHVSVFDGTEDYHEDQDAASGRFVLPFAPDLTTMLLYDIRNNNQQVASVDLVPGIQFFCEQTPNDPDCSTDILLTKSDSADPAAAGAPLDYTLTIQVVGANPAQMVQVVDTLPADVIYQSDTGGCVEAPVGTLTCDLGRVGAGDTVEITVHTLVKPDVVFNNGGPKTITNNATSANLAGADINPANDSDAEDTLVVSVADLAVTNVVVPNPPTELIIDTNVDVGVQTTVTNYGPSAPIDTHLTRTSSASAGGTATPPTIESNVLALGLNELRTIDDIFTIACSAPFPKTFTFASDIAPLNALDNDPDLSNNHGEAQLSVECVIPMEIDVRPGNPNNPINLGSNGVFQVAILTNPKYTQWLQATDLDPSTIRVAGAGVHVLGNGRYWTNERDVNKDGWTDLIVQIETNQIVPEEIVPIENCQTGVILRGSTADGIHVRGEDCVRIVPPAK